MAQTNYTPISLYYSTTASAVPTAANLVPGELAINTNDGKLYYEDSSGVVQVLATKSTGSIGGSNTQVQFNNSGSLGGSSGLTWDGSFLTTSSIKNSALTSGRVTYAGASGLLSDSANFTYSGSALTVASGIFKANGAPSLSAASAGEAILAPEGTYGALLYGRGTTYDVVLAQRSTGVALGVLAGTNNVTFPGLVGIGTSSPSQLLHLNVTSGNVYEQISSGANNVYVGFDSARTVGTIQSNNALTFDVGSSYTTRMTIDTSGNLGIGATSAGNKLQISNGGANGVEFDVALASGTESKMLSINRTSSAYTPLNYDASLHKFFISGGQKMQLDASGNLLVGTTSTITGTKFGATSTTTSGAGEFYVNSAGADAVNAINIIKYSTTNTTAQQFIGFTINNANTGSGQINANGASQAAFGSFSDARLKENIVDLPSQLNNILALKPKEFDYIQSEGGGHQIGFVAQDMQTVYPDAISERTDGMLVVTGWSKTEARLVKAIQEQQALIESLTTRLTALENK